MNRNPYSPPQAAVGDADQEPVRTKPVAIRRALVLMWSSFGLNLFTTALDWRYQISQVPALILILSQVFGLGIALWLFWKIGVGRNWARVVYLVLLLIGLTAVVPEIVTTAARAAHIAGLKMIEVGLDIASMVLVFGPGREWFRKRT
jgi:hypothetical protein